MNKPLLFLAALLSFAAHGQMKLYSGGNLVGPISGINCTGDGCFRLGGVAQLAMGAAGGGSSLVWIDGGTVTAVVSNFPATQAVSGTLTCNAGSGTLAVSLASVPSHAVTGPMTNAEARAAPLPVGFDGGYVSILNASLPVTGAFWQATQPVSLASAPTTPVTGTFWQATQPVSVASMPITPTASRAVAYGSSPTPVSAGTTAGGIMDLEGIPYANNGHPRTILCNLVSSATTSTQVTGCELVASNSIYVTSITVGGGVATGATTPAIIQTGTSTGCTGPVVIYRCGHIAQDTCTITFPTPIKTTAAHGICLLDATVGTKWVTITGYVAP